MKPIDIVIAAIILAGLLGVGPVGAEINCTVDSQSSVCNIGGRLVKTQDISMTPGTDCLDKMEAAMKAMEKWHNIDVPQRFQNAQLVDDLETKWSEAKRECWKGN